MHDHATSTNRVQFPRNGRLAAVACIQLVVAGLTTCSVARSANADDEPTLRVVLPPPRPVVDPAQDGATQDGPLDATTATAILDRFAELVESRSAYAARGSGRWKDALAALRTTVNDGTTRAALARELSRVLARVGDGHASIEGGPPPMPQRLPFLLVPLTAAANSPIVAVAPNQSNLLDPKRPFIARLDGEPIDAVLARAATLVADASPQLVRGRACRVLGRIGEFRSDLGKAPDAPVELVLVDATGRDEATLRLELLGQALRLPPWPPTESGRLADGTAMLRLATMDDDAAKDAARIMDALAPGEPLVIDVRGNRGGSREALRAIATRLLLPRTAPMVFNAARPLLVDGAVPAEISKALGERGLRPIDDAAWTPEELAAARLFADAAVAISIAEQPAGDARFGPLHVAMISPAPLRPDDAMPPASSRPVAVLCDPQCFSAADVFLAAMKEIPGVIVVGQPSGGGSGAAQRFDLGEGFSLRLSTMASFQPDGTPFDGFGVTPDVVVVPDPLDFTARGSDRTLTKALELLHATRR